MKYKTHKLSEIEKGIQLAIKHSEVCECLNLEKGTGVRYPKINDMARRISGVFEYELSIIFDQLGYKTITDCNGNEESVRFALKCAFGEIYKMIYEEVK